MKASLMGRGSPLGSLLGGSAIATMQIARSISLAALVFTGELAGVLPRASAAFLFGGFIAVVAIGRASSFPGMMAGSQDTTAVLLAAIVASAGLHLETSTRESTILVLVAVSSLVVGGGLYTLGRFGWGSLVRYIPSPVINGFVAGTGWLLLAGGMSVAIDSRLDVSNIADFVSWSAMQFWLPALLLATLITLGSRRGWHPIFVPALLLIGAAAVYLAALALSSVEQLRDGGWLLGPFAAETGWTPPWSDFATADWAEVARQAPGMIAVLFVAAIGLLLNLSALEASTSTDIDLDRELRVAGVANLVGGAGGGAPSYHLLGDTLLTRSIGAATRTAPLITGAFVLAALIFGAGAIAAVPRALAGGMLAALGVSLLWSWIAGLGSRPMVDRVVQIAVLLVMVIIGVLEGVIFGVVLAAGLFIVGYSRLDPIRSVRDGTTTVSRVDRLPGERQVLDRCARSVVVIEVSGFLFFGSAVRVNAFIRELLDEERDLPLEFLIVDMSAVAGMDASALDALERGRELCESSGVGLLIAGPSSDVAITLERSAIETDHDLDHALETCEQRLLERHGVDEYPATIVAEILALTAFLPEQRFDAGQAVFNIDEPADHFHVVVEGEMSVWFEAEGTTPLRIRRLGPGSLVGELGFFTGADRSARVTAESDVMVRTIDQPTLDQWFASTPETASAFQHEVLVAMARRIAATNRSVRRI